MKISLVTETYSPEVNGVANTLGYWVKGMQEKSIAVQIVRPKQHSDDVDHSAHLESHVTVPGLPIPGYKDLKFGLPRTRKLRRLWKKQRPDAVYIATEGPLGWSAERAARSLDIPVISGFHTNFQQYSRFYGVGWLEKIILAYLRGFHNRTRATLVPTLQQQQVLENLGFANVHVLSRGIDSQKFNPKHRSEALRAQWQARIDDPVYIYVGRIAPEKNVQLLIEMFDQSKRKDKPIKLVMVGDGPLRNKLAQTHPDIIFAGMKTGHELATHYASADIFLFPSKTDTFGNVVTEAMASRLAIVSFNDAAAKEHLRHKASGLLADLDADQEFINNALLLESNPELIYTIREAALRISESIAWESIVDGLINHLLGDQFKIEEHDYGDDKNIGMVS